MHPEMIKHTKELAARLQAGETLDDLAKDLGIKRHSLKCRLNRAGFTTTGDPRPPTPQTSHKSETEKLAEMEDPLPPPEEWVSRSCLRCQESFDSPLPKSKNRICPTCTHSIKYVDGYDVIPAEIHL